MTRSFLTCLPAATRSARPDFSLATINIVFLLLLFFLLAGTVTESAEEAIDPAETTSLALRRLPRPLLVVRTGDDIRLDGRPVSRSELADALRALRGPGKPAPRLAVLAPRDLPADTLLVVLAEVSAAGVPVDLVTLNRAPSAGRRR